MSYLFSSLSFLSLSLIDRRGSERTSSPRERAPGKIMTIYTIVLYILENVFIFPSHHHRRFAISVALYLYRRTLFGCKTSRRRKGRRRVSVVVVVVQGNVFRLCLSSLSTIEKRCVNAHTRDKTVIEHERLYPKR